MKLLHRSHLTLVALFCFHTIILLYLLKDLSISYNEAVIYYDKINFIHIIAHLSTSIFGETDFALRFPFLLFYLGSGLLLYLLTDDYFKHPNDRLLSVSIFMMLPGVNSAALLVNESIVVIFFTLLYLYLYKLYKTENYILLTLFLFIDNSFAILFLALFIISMKKRDNFLLIYSLILFGISMSMYGFEMGGRPQGYFIDTFAIYASIFSPLLFLYFFFSIYRVGLKEPNKDMYWYISATALGLSLIFSIRQKVAIEDFAPFVVIAIPVMLRLFLHSLRVRIKQFRTYLYIGFSLVITTLILNFLVVIFNKPLYKLLDNPEKHFAYRYHIAKEVVHKLKLEGITDIHIDDQRLRKRLEFYGIKSSNKYRLSRFKISETYKEFTIEYSGEEVAKYYIHYL
jgi:hypothetical protein